MKIYIKTYGCTFNKADSDYMSHLLKRSGHQIVSGEEGADIIVLNSCAVKDATESKILFKLRKLRNRKVVVAGCLSQVAPERVLKAHPGAVLLGTNALDKINEAVKCAEAGVQKSFLEHFDSPRIFSAVDGVISRIQISSGCLSNCSYCLTKFARGSLKSRAPEIILEEIKNALRRGAKEIELTAQDTGCYGVDIKSSLPKLASEIVKIEGNFKVRIGMANPQYVYNSLDEFIEMFSSPKIYKFIHIPVQSGSNKVLKEMRRAYTTEQFLEIVKRFRKRFPEITIATDVIVGYPTETEKDFEQSIKLLEETRPTITNISKFSKRPGTDAAKLKSIRSQTVDERSRIVSKLVRKISFENNKKFVGKKMKVLATEVAKGGVACRADNYLTVLLPLSGNALGKFFDAEITNATSCYLAAKLQ